MANRYTDNGDGTYTIEKDMVCCQASVTKAELQAQINAVAANITALGTRKTELEADLAAINALP